MSKNKKHNKKNATPNRFDRYDLMKIPAQQESSIEFVLEARQKVEIPLEEYRALVEAAFAVKVFKKCIKYAKWSSEYETFAKAIFGEEKPTPDETPEKDGEQNDG